MNRIGKGIVRAGYGNKKRWKNRKSWSQKKNGFLMAPRLLTNFEEQKYYQSEPRFNGVYSKDNLTKIKNRAYVINFDEYYDIGLHCMY